MDNNNPQAESILKILHHEWLLIPSTHAVVTYLEEMRKDKLEKAESASMNSFVSNQEQIRLNLISAGTIKTVIEEITKNHNVITGTHQNK